MFKYEAEIKIKVKKNKLYRAISNFERFIEKHKIKIIKDAEASYFLYENNVIYIMYKDILMHKAKTIRVSAGSMIPSSQRRAVL